MLHQHNIPPYLFKRWPKCVNIIRHNLNELEAYGHDWGKELVGLRLEMHLRSRCLTRCCVRSRQVLFPPSSTSECFGKDSGFGISYFWFGTIGFGALTLVSGVWL